MDDIQQWGELSAVETILSARDLPDLSMKGSVLLESVEYKIGIFNPAGAFAILRHAASASRARDLEMQQDNAARPKVIWG